MGSVRRTSNLARSSVVRVENGALPGEVEVAVRGGVSIDGDKARERLTS
jgi:hypothetical protein